MKLVLGKDTLFIRLLKPSDLDVVKYIVRRYKDGKIRFEIEKEDNVTITNQAIAFLTNSDNTNIKCHELIERFEDVLMYISLKNDLTASTIRILCNLLSQLLKNRHNKLYLYTNKDDPNFIGTCSVSLYRALKDLQDNNIVNSYESKRAYCKCLEFKPFDEWKREENEQ